MTKIRIAFVEDRPGDEGLAKASITAFKMTQVMASEISCKPNDVVTLK